MIRSRSVASVLNCGKSSASSSAIPTSETVSWSSRRKRIERDGPAEYKQLIAYYVPTLPGAVHVVQLREQLRATLPDYMVPAVFVELESLPLTLSGKINRQALSTREVVHPGDRAVVLPQSELEAQLLAIWKAVLHTEQIGVDDGFFDVGGDSLLLVTVADRIRDDLGYDVRSGQTCSSMLPSTSSWDLAATIRPPRPPRRRAPWQLRIRAGSWSDGNSTDPVSSQPTGLDAYQNSLAIIGISCQFPGATDHFRFWQNLRSGTENVRVLLGGRAQGAGMPEVLIQGPPLHSHPGQH